MFARNDPEQELRVLLYTTHRRVPKSTVLNEYTEYISIILYRVKSARNEHRDGSDRIYGEQYRQHTGEHT